MTVDGGNNCQLAVNLMGVLCPQEHCSVFTLQYCQSVTTSLFNFNAAAGGDVIPGEEPGEGTAVGDETDANDEGETNEEIGEEGDGEEQSPEEMFIAEIEGLHITLAQELGEGSPAMVPNINPEELLNFESQGTCWLVYRLCRC